MAELLLDGVPLPRPDSLTMSLEPLGSRDRAADGTLVLDGRGFKKKLTVLWASLPAGDEPALRQRLTGPAFFSLSLPSAYGAGAELLYCALLSYEASAGPSPAGTPLTWTHIRAVLEEQ